MSKSPHFNVGTWTPELVGDFLAVHGFRSASELDGDDCLLIGKDPQGKDAQVAYPVMRKQLTPGTMRDSVMRHSGYSKKHWDYWRNMRKGDRKTKKCCEDVMPELS